MAGEVNFDTWLCEKLKSLQLDEDVFLDYLKGVLEEEGSEDEKKETISNILAGATEEPITEVCNEILRKWIQTGSVDHDERPTPKETCDTDEKIRDIIHKQQMTLAVSKATKTTDDEIKRRLLEQYSHTAEDENSDEDEKKATSKSETTENLPSLFENINAKSVVEQQRVQREKQKKAHEEKREKDKMNREVEKLKKQERQEKEKKRTQKGERRAR